MAKRKRLSPMALQAEPNLQDRDVSASGSARRAPIADMAGDAAASAALAEVTQAMETARAEGRLILSLPLADVEAGHLLRDRLPATAATESTLSEDSAALLESLRQRGQQVPIEVRDMGPDHLGPRYGLISGWRRLMALRELHAETGDEKFATVLAMLRQPDTAAEAYVAMVEENEIRVGLSYYERARVAARAAEAGVFDDASAAIDVLFAAASKAKRSKIRSFVRVYEGLEDWLAYPSAIPERLGLKLARALEAGARTEITDALSMAAPANPEEEMAALTRGAASVAGPKATSKTRPARGDAAPEVVPGIRLKRGRSGLTLSGPGVDGALEEALAEWLRRRGF
ncbi:ParB N-terminal domain-containing protein [Gymnodinialimonas ulvae]|uniref:ParB N-terminal domain-containing protein n=1 Tax=Gymnodinialimonas ulvae TaxID=3126504 RepID=UPI0030B474C3